MAKEEKGEGYDFIPPDFDEDAFIHKEMVAFKTTSILFVWAIVAAAVSWGLFVYFKGDDGKAWPAGLAVCAVFGLLLKPIFQRTADISHFKRSNWVGTGFLFFFSWLAFFVVAVNPPISDFSAPQVQVSTDLPLQSVGDTVNIRFLATDNAGLTGPPVLKVTRDGQPVDIPDPAYSPATADGEHYLAVLSNPTTAQAGRYNVRVEATDGRGHATSAQTNFTVSASDLVKVTMPRGGMNLTGADEIAVEVDARPCAADRPVPPCLRTVYMARAGKEAVPFEYSDIKGAWLGTARLDKWDVGVNSGPIVAEFIDHFLSTTKESKVDGGEIRSKETYTLNVQPPAERHTVEVPPQPPQPSLNVPGYGLLGALLAVLGGAFLLRRRTGQDAP